MCDLPELVVVTGPTATGKTDAAVLFAQRCGGEIVSADSMLVYRGMDVATAKPTRAQQALVAHHMIDVADPREDYSVARWLEGADAAIADIRRRGKLPVVAGGTGLYIRALLRPMSFGNTSENSEIRAKWERFSREKGAGALHEALDAVDPEAAARLHQNDTRRVVRALEVYEATGETLTSRLARDAAEPDRYRALVCAVDLPRELLYARINARVDRMLAQGLVAEVSGLLAQGVPQEATAMQALGYKEIALALRGECPMEEAVETLKRRTRNFAKRQLTWFRAEPGVHWLRAQTPLTAREIAQYIGETAKRAGLSGQEE